MRSILLAAPLAAAAIAVSSSPLPAQEIQVNQRFTAPTAQADAYAGVTLGHLILALGLSLQGLPPNLKGDELRSRLQALAEPQHPARRGKPAAPAAPLLAAQPVVPAVAAAATVPAVVPATVQAVPAVMQTEVPTAK
jgi:hypothetical protein